MARSSSTCHYVEVPIAEESMYGCWQKLDYSDESYVQGEDLRSRKMASSALQMRIGTEMHVLFWRVRVHEGKECLDVTELASNDIGSGENFRFFFSDPIISVNFFPSERDNLVMLLVVLSSGVRMALLPLVPSVESKENVQYVTSSLNTEAARVSLGRALESLQFREGTSLTCSDATLIESDADSNVFLLIGTSSSSFQRAKIFYDGRPVVWNESSASSWMSSLLFRSPAKSSTMHDRLCAALIADEIDVWYSLSEDGKMRKWQSGKVVLERFVKIEKVIGGVKHAFLAFDMATISDSMQDILVFSLRAEHASVSLMAWCNCKDYVVHELDSGINNLIAERLKELGDTLGVQKIKSIKKVRLDGQDEIVSVWYGYNCQVISISRFRMDVWEHCLIHTVSLEISSEVEIAKLHIECMQKKSGDTSKGDSEIDSENYLESLIFRPRWFHRKLIVSSTNELLLSKGIPSEIFPDSSSHTELKAYVRDKVESLARSTLSIDQTIGVKSLMWWELFRLCFSKWRSIVDECLGVCVVDNKVLLLKNFAISHLRQQRTIEQAFFGSSSEPSGDLLFRVAYNCLIWAQDADPGGVRFSWEMNKIDSKAALRGLLTSSLMNIAQLPSDCDPDMFLKAPARLTELHNKLQDFFKDCDNISRAILSCRDVRHREAPAEEYAASQQMYVYMEVLRGVGLFLSMLIHFDTSGSALVTERLGAVLDWCCKLLKVFHILRWTCTRGNSAPNSFIWAADGSLLSMAISFRKISNASPHNLSVSMGAMNLANSGRDTRRSEINVVHELVCLMFGQLCYGRLNSNACDPWKELSLWKEMLNLMDVVSIHEVDKNDKLNPCVIALMQAVCCIHLSKFELAEKHLNTMLDASRNSVGILQDFADHYLYPEEEKTRKFQDVFGSIVVPTDSELLKLIDVFFALHDEKFGVFTKISAFLDRSGSRFEESKYRLRLTELSSLHKLAALAVKLKNRSNYFLSDALSMLAAQAYNDALLRVANYFCMSVADSDMTLPFDLAYSLIADRIKDCCDITIEDLRKKYERDPERLCYVERICAWCSACDGSLSEVISRETEKVHEFLYNQRKQNAYQLLRTFVDKLHSKLLLHRVCAYPWVGCSQTVDSLLEKLCDVPGQGQIDAAYRARYAFNISRSDYKTAGETMATLCFNLSSAVADDISSRIMVPALRKQAEICLASINAYSLIDEQFAFFKLRNTVMHINQRAKRQGEPNADSEGRSKHFKTDASTMGWQVTTAPDSVDTSMNRIQDKSESHHVLGPNGFGYSGGELTNASQSEKMVTLDMLRKHYTLLRLDAESQLKGSDACRDRRSRIKLAERAQRGGAVGGTCRPVPMFQQDMLAAETVKELVEAGLSDDAVSLALEYQMDLPTLAVLLTLGCIESSNAVSYEQVYMSSSMSAEATREQDLSCHQAWSALQAQLAYLDDYRRSRAVWRPASGAAGAALGMTPSGMDRHKLEACSSALALSSVFGVAACVILQHASSPAMPTWLYKVLKEGAEGRERTRSGGDVTWADRGNACGLACLLLRSGRIEVAINVWLFVVGRLTVLEREQGAGQVALECVEGAALSGPSMGLGPAEAMDLRHARYLAWNQVGCVVDALGAIPTGKGSQEQLEAALARRLEGTGREARFLDAWTKAMRARGNQALVAAVEQGWRDLGRGAMTYRSDEAGWWECLREIRAVDDLWRQVCSKVWQDVLLSDVSDTLRSAAGNDVRAYDLSSQLLARI